MISHDIKPTVGQKGFSILETLLYMAVVGLILVAASASAFAFVSAKAKSSALLETSRNARLSVSRIAAEIRQAAGVNPGDSVFGSSPGRLSLITDSAPTNPTVFSVSGGRLYVQLGSGGVEPLTSARVNVSEFIVDDVSTAGRTKAFRIRLKVEYVNTGGLQELTAETVLETTAQIKKADGHSS